MEISIIRMMGHNVTATAARHPCGDSIVMIIKMIFFVKNSYKFQINTVSGRFVREDWINIILLDTKNRIAEIKKSIHACKQHSTSEGSG